MCSCELTAVPMQVSVYPDEGLHGYLLRVSEHNFYERLHWTTALANISSAENKSAFMLMAEQAEDIARVTGGNPDVLASMGYTGSIFKGERMVTGFGGMKLPAISIEYKTPKVCPDCLLETPYIRQVWDLSMLTVCPHHGTRLVNTCPDCDKPITWNRANVESCDCGGDFSFAQSMPASEPMVGLSRIIWNALASTCEKLDVLGVYPEALETMDYMAVAKVCAYLDGVIMDDTMISSAKLHGVDLYARYAVLETGAEILWDWPQNWHALIQQTIDENHDGKKGLGLQKTFGKMYVHLFAKENDGVFGFLRDEFIDYLQNSDYAVKLHRKGNPRILQGRNVDLPYMTFAEVRRELNLTRRELNKLIEKNILEVFFEPTASSAVHRVTLKSVEAYKARPRGKIVGARAVSDFLGMSLPSVMKLLEIGRIRASRAMGPKGREPWRIHSDDAIEFRENLNAHTQTCSLGTTAWLFSYRSALAKLNAAGVQADDLIEGLLTGDLGSFRVSQFPARLDAMFFDPENLDAFVSARLSVPREIAA